jgi:chromosome segregation ATPase
MKAGLLRWWQGVVTVGLLVVLAACGPTGDPDQGDLDKWQGEAKTAVAEARDTAGKLRTANEQVSDLRSRLRDSRQRVSNLDRDLSAALTELSDSWQARDDWRAYARDLERELEDGIARAIEDLDHCDPLLDIDNPFC